MCCAPNTLCALDPLGQVACCPVGSFCTGTLAANPGTTTVAATSPTSGPAMLGTTTTTTEGFVVAATTTPAAGAAPGSTIANAPFPFVFLPTTYTNAAECSSYYSSCQTEYSSCAASLGGHVNGVTVSGAGVGITVAGATATATVDASSVCSSLSAQACYGLQLSQCPSYGGSTGAVVNINAAPTRGVGGGGTFGVWGAGVVVGIVGHVFV
ncbi:MAG: hypothetical protein M1827_003236 [Pycnora praestabilis]|nr:MAG: hypothetical protein M1827_003236 [Pycnora praestabilis]